jgi:DNA-binding response OmpR family regulator
MLLWMLSAPASGCSAHMPNAQRILIVDDDTSFREALVEQFRLHEEFDPVSAESGTEGLEAAKGGQVDLVIMDVGLPTLTAARRFVSCARTASRRRSSC